jgi:hypothetical protein
MLREAEGGCSMLSKGGSVREVCEQPLSMRGCPMLSVCSVSTIHKPCTNAQSQKPPPHMTIIIFKTPLDHPKTTLLIVLSMRKEPALAQCLSRYSLTFYLASKLQFLAACIGTTSRVSAIASS